ncbi:MAG: PEP-CTERM sorting domain-containing protein [Planctomycetales bacterium]|nr:PEP-CTERM sorting domain-containing protein [Planctomycetales bacterium]MCA9167990.1 PEP-CTERM sorting domain-containing protein [Planctomycetales bacterium]
MSVKRLGGLVAALAIGAMVTPDAHGQLIIRTRDGIGADAEVRESAPDQNRGTSTEIASRIKESVPGGDPADGGDRNSSIYLKFDLSNVSVDNVPGTTLRLTYRNTNLAQGRVQNDDTKEYTGISFYGLDVNNAGNDWSESTITYNTAPGISPDGNIGTKDYNTSAGNLIPLGTQLFPQVTPQNHLPVGGALDFSSAALDQLITDAVNAGKPSVTIVAGVSHDGDDVWNDWLNFNYLFNPKEQLTLNNDSYDADTSDDVPAVTNLFGTDNSAGAFDPQLIMTVPEPSSVVLAGMSVLGLLAHRRRR